MYFLPSCKVLDLSGNCKNVLPCKTYVKRESKKLFSLQVFRNVCFWNLEMLSDLENSTEKMLSVITALANLPHR